MLSDDRITDVSLQHIARMPALKTLWFQDCSVSDEGLELLRGSPTIEYLLIRNTQVTTAGLRTCRHCRISGYFVSVLLHRKASKRAGAGSKTSHKSSGCASMVQVSATRILFI